MQKKLYIILDDSRISGISLHTLQICKNLRNKFLCRVLLPKQNSNKLIRKLNENKISYKFIKLNKISKKNFINFIFNFYTNYKNLCNFMSRTGKNDILIIQGSLQFISILSSYLSSCKKILYIHDSFINGIFKFILKKILTKNMKVIFVSKKSYHFYKNVINGCKYKIIPNGVITYKKIKKKKSVKKKLKIGTTCNINPEKNLELLIKLAKITPEFAYYIVGPIYATQRKYFLKIKKEIKYHNIRNLKFLGYKKNVFNFLREIDIYCCFSLRESSPFSLWEAMSVGLPIISTDVGDLKKYIKVGKFGYIVKNEPNIFKSKIYNLLNNKNLYNLFSKNSFRFVKYYLNESKQYNKIHNFLMN